MKLKFPLSPRPEHTLTFHSIEFKRLVLIDFVMESLLQGNSILITYDDDIQLQGLEEFIDLKVNDKTDFQHQLFTHLTTVKRHVNDVINCSKLTKRPIFGKQHFWELADLYFNNFPNQKPDFSVSDFPIQHINSDFYKTLKTKVNKASELLTDEVKYLLKTSVVKQSAFIDSNDSENVAIKYIETFTQRAQEINQRINTFFSTYRSSRYLPFEELLGKVKDSCEQWKEMLLNFGLEPKISFTKELRDGLMQLRDLCEERAAVQEDLNLKYTEELITKFEHSFQKKIEQEFKMLNFRNANDGQLIDINLDIINLIKNINDSQLFKETFSINSLSLKLSSEALENLLHKLNCGFYELNKSGAFAKWMHFYQKLDVIEAQFIKEIMKLPIKKWQAIFDQWFLYKLLVKNGLNDQLNIFEKLEEIDNAWEQIRFDFSNIASDIMQSNTSSLRFCKLDQLASHKADCLVNLSHTGQNLVEQNSNNFGYILGLKPKKKNEDNAQTQLHESMLATYEMEDELDAALQNSKLLAAYFLEASERTDLFLAPDSNIIIDSAFSDLKIILSDFVKGAKYIKRRENAFKLYTEFFLNQSSTAYYFYDQSALIFETEEDVYRHISKIKALQVAGYYTISVDRSRFYDKAYMETIINPQIDSANA